MILYFLRHGLAGDSATWQGDDSLRPLTDLGIKKLNILSDVLQKQEPNFDLIITSPYLRALQTAEIVAKKLNKPDALIQDQRLCPGFGLDNLDSVLQDHLSSVVFLFVGHEPDFSETVSDLIGGGRLIFKKAGIARVEVINRNPLQGELAWLAPPKLLID